MYQDPKGHPDHVQDTLNHEPKCHTPSCHARGLSMLRDLFLKQRLARLAHQQQQIGKASGARPLGSQVFALRRGCGRKANLTDASAEAVHESLARYIGISSPSQTQSGHRPDDKLRVRAITRDWRLGFCLEVVCY